VPERHFLRANVVNQTETTSRTTFDKLTLALDSGAFVDVRRMLNGLPPGDVAHLL
jgi:magnesium transporter